MAAILERKISKKSKLLHAKIIVTKSWNNSIEIFSVSHFAIFSNRSNLFFLILKNPMQESLRHKFDQNPLILSFSCFALFLVMADNPHLGM